jgi:hypothetical protein
MVRITGKNFLFFFSFEELTTHIHEAELVAENPHRSIAWFTFEGIREGLFDFKRGAFSPLDTCKKIKLNDHHW